jgi:predicted O-methyltransferase YrrM
VTKASWSAKVSEYDFTARWFEESARFVWDQLIPQIKPTRILEVGSYEGASACYLINAAAPDSSIEIHCVDSWEGGAEHQSDGLDMREVESRFKHNTQLAIANSRGKVELVVHKGLSDVCLARLMSEGKRGYFDFVYIDGSHQAPDVLCDAVLGFKLLKIGGWLAFDDYLWAETGPTSKDPLRCPKPAIDAFVNIHFQKVHIIKAPLYQLYMQKVAD